MLTIRKLMVFAVILIIIIIAMMFTIFQLNKSKEYISLTVAEQTDEIIIDNKKIKNPTFQDVGYLMNGENMTQALVKLIDIEDEGQNTYLKVQFNKDSDNIQKILIQSSNLKFTLININPDKYIYTNNQGDMIMAKSKNELKDRLNKQMNKNILLNLYTKSNNSELNNYIACNKKLISQIKAKNNQPLNCNPAVWDITIYDN